MGNFNKRGGGRFGGGDRNFRGKSGGRTEMHKAICTECGAQCEVPFKPTGDKPVLCNDCFKNSGRSGDGGKDRRGRRDDRGERRMYQATCAECGNRCEVPFKPTGDKPVLCSKCFGGGGSPTPNKPSQSNEKHDEILAKLDKILTLLQRTNAVKEVTVMKEKPVKEEVKEVKKNTAKKAPAKKVAKKITKKKAPAKKVAKKKK